MSVAPSGSEPTETSPLLNSSYRKLSNATDPGVGIAPADPSGTALQDGESNGSQAGEQSPGAGTVKPDDGLLEVRKNMKYIFPAIAIGVFLSAADQTIIVSSYGIIGSELGALQQTSWIATSFFLTLTSFQPLYGKLSDIFGRKPCLLVAYAIFGIGCLLCGLARNINELIAARAFSGVGAGGMTTVVSVILSDSVTLRERGTFQGYINIVYATGAALGAPLGGVTADYISWRFAFYFQAPLCLMSIVAVSLTLHLPKRETQHWKQKIRRIDFLGALVLICAVSTLLLALDRGSNVSWRVRETYIPLAMSLPLSLAFILVEFKVAAEPFAPKRALADKGLLAAYLCNFFSFAGWLAAYFFIPLHLQVVHGLTATEASVLMIPSAMFGVAGSLFAGIYMQKTGRYYWLTVVCYTTLVLGVAVILLCSGVLVRSKIGIVIGMCLAAWSNGQGVTSSLIALISNAPKEDQAVVTACSYLFRSLGSVFGISLSATIYNTMLRKLLVDRLGNGADAAKISERVKESLAFIKTLKPSIRALVVDCYMESTQAAFALEVLLVAGAAASAWFLTEKTLNRQ